MVASDHSQSLRVKNLRAVRQFEIDGLGSFVIIAGQNGCGKSCLFDAIRLLKSFYGGYQQEEHMQWFNELAIDVQDLSELRRMFRDPSSPMEINAVIELSPSEQQFMLDQRADLVWPIAWHTRVPEAPAAQRSIRRLLDRARPEFGSRGAQSLPIDVDQVLAHALQYVPPDRDMSDADHARFQPK
jgi:AAA domain